MPVYIYVDIKDKRWKASIKNCQKLVRDTCEAALPATKHKKELSLVLASDAFIKKLNRDFRGKDTPTNVLSFPGEGDYLGDIALAFETIKREAKEQGKDMPHHLMHLVVHGVLHVLGHDHQSASEALAMEQNEIKILKKLMVANPYL